MSDEVKLSISKAQFYGGVLSILLAVGAFGVAMRNDVTSNRHELESVRSASDARFTTNEREIAALRKLTTDERNARSQMRVLLTEMRGTMTQIASDVKRTSDDVKSLTSSMKDYAERLVKMEAYRDGPSGGK